MQKRHIARGGFALPTVLIASVVMLTILAVSVSSVAAVRTSLKTQYYEQLAKAAGEAGVAYAKACLAKNGNKPLWTDTKPLTPSTDCAGNQLLEPRVQALIVGGGGGGGNTGSGGGGGGVIYEEGIPVAVASYPVVVGAGGAGGAQGSAVNGANGSDSSFAGLVAEGGGAGRTHGQTGVGASGGSTGGGTIVTSGTPGSPGVAVSGQGNPGGAGFLDAGWVGTNAGGGGAGGPGSAAGNVAGSGNGGPGLTFGISGAMVTYGSGGGGGEVHGTIVGIGGVGAGNAVVASAGGSGTANTGGGGAGGSYSGYNAGGNGGSGIVVISYPNNGSIQAIVSGTATTHTVGVNKVHVFNGNGTFQVQNASVSSCPTDPRCSVVVNGTLRSSFSVARPAVDASGRAVTLPNSGYVELLRSSTGQVWRTYRQPAVQVAVVPDLCSGAASTALGWQKAIVSSNQQAIPTAGTAQSITLVDADISAGKMYFRKDFTVFEAGTYTLTATSPATNDEVLIYVDGTLRTTVTGSLTTASIALTPGCHTITAQLTNKTLTPRASKFTAAIQRSGSNPIVVTDGSWRVSAGNSVHFSQSDYYADPSIWQPVVENANRSARVASASWTGTQDDPLTPIIAPPGNGCSAACPSSSTGYMRDDENFYVTTPTEVQISTLCDDDCSVFLDGEMVIANSPWSAVNQQTLTLTPGAHRLAVRLYNGGTTGFNPSAAAVSVVVKSTGQVLARTDSSWLGSTIWTPGTNETAENIRSYEASFIPTPDEIPRADTYDVLVVAGGGGGAGNCATCGGAGGGGGGGVIYQEGVLATTGNRTVTIGAGGAAGAGAAARTNGGNGGNSAFGGLVATGGGGGGSQLGTPGLNGGSGGGGSGGGSPAPGNGGNGVNGQGFPGGNGVGDPYSGGGGGGAGGSGVHGAGVNAGHGGSGIITYITGVKLTVGGGGGGGAYATNSPGISDVGAGNGVNQNTNSGIGYPGVTNTALTNGNASAGGGGGGGNGLNRGGAGGAGGAGVVIVRVKTGSMTISTTGSPATTNVTINGVAYTIYRFTASGSFNITAL